VQVTPSLLFNSDDRQAVHHRQQPIAGGQLAPINGVPGGGGGLAADSMVQLPWVVQRGAFSSFRAHVGQLHPEHGGTYDGAMHWFAFDGPEVKRSAAIFFEFLGGWNMMRHLLTMRVLLMMPHPSCTHQSPHLLCRLLRCFRTQIQHTAMGNFMYKYCHDMVSHPLPDPAPRSPAQRGKRSLVGCTVLYCRGQRAQGRLVSMM